MNGPVSAVRDRFFIGEYMKKKKAVKKEVKAKPVKVKAVSFEDQIKSALSHILELFKASLIDAFRQYIESKIFSGQPASVEEFKSKLKHSVAVHGIADEVLLEALDEVELEYLNNQVGNKVLQLAPTSAPAVERTKTEVKSVFDSLDDIEL